MTINYDEDTCARFDSKIERFESALRAFVKLITENASVYDLFAIPYPKQFSCSHGHFKYLPRCFSKVGDFREFARMYLVYGFYQLELINCRVEQVTPGLLWFSTLSSNDPPGNPEPPYLNALMRYEESKFSDQFINELLPLRYSRAFEERLVSSTGALSGVGEILLPHLIPRMIFEALKDLHDAQTITDEMLANELSRVDRTYGSTTWLCNAITDPVKLNEAFECLVYDVVNSTDDIWGVTLEAIRDALLPSWISWTRLL
ncbi:hypothetical protein OA099_03465 [Litorivicinus sp.]|nr:hypothetical protein [Litorivicinus sp.]